MALALGFAGAIVLLVVENCIPQTKLKEQKQQTNEGKEDRKSRESLEILKRVLDTTELRDFYKTMALKDILQQFQM